MTELITRKTVAPVDWTGVPAQYVGKCSAICRTLEDCENLVRHFGDPSFAPFLPVLVHAQLGWTAIAGMGYASAAELQDCAVVLWHRQQVPIDWGDRRERAGWMRREEVEANVGDALMRRIAAHKASPVTDPPRQPKYTRVRGKTVHTIRKIEEVSDG